MRRGGMYRAIDRGAVWSLMLAKAAVTNAVVGDKPASSAPESHSGSYAPELADPHALAPSEAVAPSELYSAALAAPESHSGSCAPELADPHALAPSEAVAPSELYSAALAAPESHSGSNAAPAADRDAPLLGVSGAAPTEAIAAAVPLAEAAVASAVDPLCAAPAASTSGAEALSIHPVVTHGAPNAKIDSAPLAADAPEAAGSDGQIVALESAPPAHTEAAPKEVKILARSYNDWAVVHKKGGTKASRKLARKRQRTDVDEQVCPWPRGSSACAKCIQFFPLGWFTNEPRREGPHLVVTVLPTDGRSCPSESSEPKHVAGDAGPDGGGSEPSSFALAPVPDAEDQLIVVSDAGAQGVQDEHTIVDYVGNAARERRSRNFKALRRFASVVFPFVTTRCRGRHYGCQDVYVCVCVCLRPLHRILFER